MTDSKHPLLTTVGLIVICAIAATIWIGVSIRALRNELEAMRQASQAQTATIMGNLALVRGEVAMLRSNPLAPGMPVGRAETISREVPEPGLEVDFKTDDDAVAAIEALRGQVTADAVARVIGEIDGWIVRPEDESKVKSRLAKLLPVLRSQVKREVAALQKAGLTVTPSSRGAVKLDEAGRILALYPMSDEPAVVKEARELADGQVNAANRLDALRRQRYNQWAIGQVEQAIYYYNGNVSKWNPLNDNTALLSPLVNQLGPVDPMFLEPAVLELYNYVVDKMKGSLSEKNKLEFAKQLTDGKILRKSLGDL